AGYIKLEVVASALSARQTFLPQKAWLVAVGGSSVGGSMCDAMLLSSPKNDVIVVRRRSAMFCDHAQITENGLNVVRGCKSL
uniref:Uncharacterized protein n=1 Tax=Romanomermis culicivorax TaxID=13658 RepID=A0A915ISM4_ROMCU